MNHLAENKRLAAEQRFAYRIQQRLNENEISLSPAQSERLAGARKAALRVQKIAPAPSFVFEPRLALGSPSSGFSFGPRFSSSFGRFSLVAAALALVGVFLVGLFQFEQQQRIENLADIDSAVLSDDLPISAYADHGFNAFLKQNE